MYPTTGLGKLVATFAMVSGLLVLALPISIVGTNFLVCYEKLDERNRRARLIEELEEKLKAEEKEATQEAQAALVKKQREALDKMPWRKRGLKLAVSKSRAATATAAGASAGASTQKTSMKGFAVGFKAKKFSAAALAASWSVSGSAKAQVVGNGGDEVDDDDDDEEGGGSSVDVIPKGSRSLSAIAKGVKLRRRNKAIAKWQRQRLVQKKSIVDGHQSLVGLKARARLTPSFLYDTNCALNPPANLTFINVERKAKLLDLSIAGFGRTRHRKSNHMSDVALAVKYKSLLEKAQNVLECIQVKI
jgi:hypothetical protein